MAANFLLYFGFWLILPILPFYLRDVFHEPKGLIGIILSCYTVAALCIRPFSGYLLDTFARRPLYLLSYAVFTALFAGYILSATLSIFILLRVFHGFSFGAVTVGGNTLVVDIMPSARRGEGLGYYGLANNFAMCLGPMIGLFLYDGGASFDTIFSIALGSCLLGFLSALCVRAPRKKSASKKNVHISLDRFVLLKGIPASIALILLSIPYGTTTNFEAIYVQEIGLPVSSGYFFVLLSIGLGIARLFSGRFVDKGFVTECIHYGLYLVIFAFILLGSCAYLIQWNVSIACLCFLIVPLLQGVGFGIIFPAYNSLFINLGTHNQRATATSTYLTSWDIGIGLGILGAGIIAEHFDFSTVYFIGGLFSIGGMLFFNLIVTPHYRKNKIAS